MREEEIYKSKVSKSLMLIPMGLLVVLILKGVISEGEIFNESSVIIIVGIILSALFFLATKSVKCFFMENGLVIKECLWKRLIQYETIGKVDIATKPHFSIESASMPQIVLYDRDDKEIMRLSPRQIGLFENEIKKRIKSRTTHELDQNNE